MFYGEFDYKIDEKGRVPLPPRFRTVLKDGMVLVAGADKCITVYTLPEWKKLSDTLTGSAVVRDKIRTLNRVIFAGAFPTKLDNQGRIAIPAPLRDHAQIENDVVVAGANTYLEIWNQALWEELKRISQEKAWQIIESLENN